MDVKHWLLAQHGPQDSRQHAGNLGAHPLHDLRLLSNNRSLLNSVRCLLRLALLSLTEILLGLFVFLFAPFVFFLSFLFLPLSGFFLTLLLLFVCVCEFFPRAFAASSVASVVGWFRQPTP